MEKEQLVSLVTKSQQGDNEALNSLFNEFYNDLYYFALKTVKDDETALDVTQEAFVEIINTLGNLKEPAAFVTWAKQITYHQCTRYFKKKKDVLVDEDEDGNTVFDTLKEENAEFIPDEALDKADFKKTVMAILDELSEEQRSATMMYYFDEMSVRQIAEIQGVSEGTVKSRLNYARKAIKNSVEEYEKKHNIKLHAIPFFPFFKWLFEGAFEGGMPTASAEIVAESVTAATGTTVTVGAATTTATTATVATTATTAGAVGLGAKIASLPLATKIIAGVVAAAIAIGGSTTAVILSQKDNNDIPADNQSIVSSEDTDSNTSSETDTKNEELVLEGIIPEGCTYTLYDGTVLTAGQNFPEVCTAGDKVSYGDYLYGYECVYAKNIEGTDTWHLWKDNFDSGDSGLIESDVFGSWSVMVADQTKTSYGIIASKINGKPIKTLYATFYGCVNMTEAPKIPSTITAMTAAYNGCSALRTAPVIPSNVERIMMSFMNCTSLTGDVVINAKLDKSLKWFYTDTFSDTVGKINLTGNTPEEDLILIAKGSNNKNITVNGKRVDYDNISEKPIDQPVDESQNMGYFTVPEGCTYTVYQSGKVYQAGEDVQEGVYWGDMINDGEYVYGYGCCYVYNNSTQRFELAEGIGGSSSWTPAVIDRTKTSYSPIKSDINGEPIYSLMGTFKDCVNMTVSPEVPSTVTDLGYTYQGCKSLKKTPVLPDGITNMFDSFDGCTSLQEVVNLPSDVTEMTQCFRGCALLTTVPELPEKVESISNIFVNCSSLKNGPTVIPASVRYVSGAFSGCENLENTPQILSDKIEDMSVMFFDCKKLSTSPVIPEGVTDLSSTFNGCESLTTAPVIPDSATVLSCTFSNCTALKKAPVIPNGVTNMYMTFQGCTSLTGSVVINAQSLIKYDSCFLNTVLPISISGNCPQLSELKATANNGNVANMG